ncbi:MAG: hypothetical protein ABI318_07025, partial [Chthoniobacteraceae bacterium]
AETLPKFRIAFAMPGKTDCESPTLSPFGMNQKCGWRGRGRKNQLNSIAGGRLDYRFAATCQHFPSGTSAREKCAKRSKRNFAFAC